MAEQSVEHKLGPWDSAFAADENSVRQQFYRPRCYLSSCILWERDARGAESPIMFTKVYETVRFSRPLAVVRGSPSNSILSFGTVGSVGRDRLDRTGIRSIICEHIIDSCIEALPRSIKMLWITGCPGGAKFERSADFG